MTRTNHIAFMHLSLFDPPLERSASRGLPSVGSVELTSAVSSPDLGIPFHSVGACIVVRVA